MIYFDNNATTIMPKCVIDQMCSWMNKGNPSAEYNSAKQCRNLMEQFRNYIATNCKFISYKKGEKYPKNIIPKVYRIIFTSCASESNNTIIKSICESYSHYTGTTPHIIISSIEHKSSLLCVQQLEEIRGFEISYVKPDLGGRVNPDDVKRLIKPNTCLISVMHANNETGAINDIKAIGALAHSRNIPFHSDCVQTFGKFLISPSDNNIDAMSVSFHKLHGPPGIGALIVKNQLVEGYRLCAEICGTQNCGLRGGTENIIGIAGAFTAVKYTWKNRQAKNNHLYSMKLSLMNKLAKLIPCQTYKEYNNSPLSTNKFVVFLSSDGNDCLPNTILLSVVKKKQPFICNNEIKKVLENNNIIVSIGSACNTSNDKASHVLENADVFIKRGAIRISLGDANTMKEVNTFVECFTDIINNM